MLKRIKELTNSENKKRLISNFTSLSVLRGFQFLIPLITLPYLVRTIGIDNFGLVSFALSLGLYFGAVIQFGFGITATREIARHRENQVKLQHIFSTTLTASILLALVSVVVFISIALLVEKFNAHLSLYLFTLAYVVFQSLFPIWFFQGMEKMKYIALLTLGTSFLFLINLFIFVTGKEDYIYVPLIQAVAALFTFILSIWLIKKQFNVKYQFPRWVDLKKTYSEGRHAFISQLAPTLYNNSTVFLLGIFTSNTVVGLYSAATKVIDAAISFGYVLSNTFLPYLSRNLQRHKAFQKIMLIAGFIISTAIFVFAEFITRFLFSENNLEISEYIKWLAFSVFMAFVFLIYSTNYLMVVGLDKIAKNISLYVSLSALAFAFIVIPVFGIWGALVTLLLSRTLMAAISFLMYLKCEKLKC